MAKPAPQYFDAPVEGGGIALTPHEFNPQDWSFSASIEIVLPIDVHLVSEEVSIPKCLLIGEVLNRPIGKHLQRELVRLVSIPIGKHMESLADIKHPVPRLHPHHPPEKIHFFCTFNILTRFLLKNLISDLKTQVFREGQTRP